MRAPAHLQRRTGSYETTLTGTFAGPESMSLVSSCNTVSLSACSGAQSGHSQNTVACCICKGILSSARTAPGNRSCFFLLAEVLSL